MRIAQQQTEEEAPINLMPLIDMVFLLLIFFLVATTFAEAERDRSVKLPGSEAPHPLSDAPRDLIINITDEGMINVAGRPYDREELFDMLKDFSVNQPDREVLIRADVRSAHQHFADVV
ncbi:MAG TPA: biopolymer transporter ExbD, partial [Phycisphaerae bacterium]|nr:biopolymer transporter ExbD [Phycisphaerae bacterium]